jgi:hypothetical protein
MNKLLTALILTATAATAQAGEVYLECSVTNHTVKSLTMMVDGDKGVGDNGFGAIRKAPAPAGSGASTVMIAGSEYVMKDQLGVIIRINRQTLTWTNDDPIVKISGQCKKATSPKNQI